MRLCDDDRHTIPPEPANAIFAAALTLGEGGRNFLL